MIKLSQNLYAETLLKSLGAAAGVGTLKRPESAASRLLGNGAHAADLVIATDRDCRATTRHARAIARS